MLLFSYIVCAFLLLTSTRAFNLTDLAPVNYCKSGVDNNKTCKVEIPLYVYRLNTEESVIPFEYHHFDFCLSDESNSPVENLKEVGSIEQIRLSPFKIFFLENVECRAVCTKTYKGSDPEVNKKLNLLKMDMALYYQHHWILDNIPVTWCFLVNEELKTNCSTGFPMGCQVRRDLDTCIPILFTTPSQIGTYYLFNHVDLEITYHSGGKEDWAGEFGDNVGRIIFAKIKPASITHQDPAHVDCKARNAPLQVPSTIIGDETFSVTYTYSIKFIKNNTIKWSSRWDYILKSIPQTNIQ